MIYRLNDEFTKIEETKGMLQNRSDAVEIEFVTCKADPPKDSGGVLLPGEKYDFAVDRGESVYARCNQMNGALATLAVVNFKKPAPGDGAGVGAVIYAHTVLAGHVKADGALLNRGDYPELFAYADDNGLILSEADWANGMQGMFGAGDGIETFRAPDLRGEFLRGIDDGRGTDPGRVLGSNQKGTGTQWQMGSVGDCVMVVCYVDGEEKTLSHDPSAPYHSGQGRAASHYNYRVRPRNIALIAQIKY